MAKKYEIEDDYLRLPIKTKTAKRFFKAYIILCVICGAIPIIAWMFIIVPIFTKDRTHVVERKFEKMPSLFDEDRKLREQAKLKATTPSDSSER